MIQPPHQRPLPRLLAILMATSALAAPAAAFAQAAPQAQTPPVLPAAPPAPTPSPPPAAAPAAPPLIGVQAPSRIDRIVVRGNERIEASTVVSYLPIQVGTPVTEAQIGESISALGQSGLFSDINITTQGSDLIVQVVENPIINRVIFEGEKALKEDKLSDEVTIRPRGIFTRARVQQDVQRILELYRQSGRISATVTPKIVELPQKRVDLIFEIDEGPKSGILDINFLGNTQYSDNDLRDVIRTEKSTWYKFLSNNANYDPDRVEYDESLVTDYYRNRGYYDFQILSSVSELRPDKNGFVLTFTIDEGRQYKFGDLKVETELNKLDGSILQRLLPIQKGELYQAERIEQARDALVFAAGSAGFAFVEIDPTFTPNPETGVLDVTFKVSEGPRVYVERIDIVGNTETLDRVIRREMQLVEGDAFNRVLLDRSKQNIAGLRFFKEQDIVELPGSAPDKTVLRVNVTEQPTGELAFSAGYSSIEQMIIDFSIVQRNFRGRGQYLNAQARTGSYQQNVNFSFTEPRFLGRNLGAGFDLFTYRYDFEQQAGYTLNMTGGSLRLGFPLSLNSSLQLQYSLRTDDLQVSALTCGFVVRPALCNQVGSNITSLASATWSLRKLNDPVQPTRGYTLSATQEIAGIGGDINYLKTDLDASWYYGFNKDFIFSATGQAGFIAAYGGDAIRINDRFFKGGQTFRGFEIAGIGPRDTTFNNALGGKNFGIVSLELTVPTFLPENFPVKASLFTDFGTLGGIDREDKFSCSAAVPPVCNVNAAVKDDYALRAAAGISIGWKVPGLGPIQLDFSRVLAKQPYDITETFRFSTSTRF